MAADYATAMLSGQSHVHTEEGTTSPQRLW
jgi:hypothetical protein